jgi:transcription antitermination factor NusG
MLDRSPPDVLLRTGPWCVLHTKARQEKKLARWLGGRALPYYLPMLRPEGAAERPLLSGYLFTPLDREAARAAFDSRALAACVETADPARLADELRRLDWMLREKRVLAARAGLAPGREVELARGPLRGLRGVVARHENELRLMVRLEVLGRVLELAVRPDELEPA